MVFGHVPLNGRLARGREAAVETLDRTVQPVVDHVPVKVRLAGCDVGTFTAPMHTLNTGEGEGTVTKLCQCQECVSEMIESQLG